MKIYLFWKFSSLPFFLCCLFCF